MDIQAFNRFFRYSLVGGSTFLFDLFLLYIFIDLLGMNSVFAAGLGFLIAVSINYLISRKFVFKGTEKAFKKGYVHFIIIAVTGALFVMAGMYVLVNLLAVHYLFSRIAVAGVTGTFNYVVNLYFNFKVVGKKL